MLIEDIERDIESGCPLAGTEHFIENCRPAHYLARLFSDEDCLECGRGWIHHKLVLGFARCNPDGSHAWEPIA